MPQGANRRHKRQGEKAGENIVGVAGLGCVVDRAVLRRSVCGGSMVAAVAAPEVGKMQGVGWASRHYRTRPTGAASFLCGKGVKEVFGSPWLPLLGRRRSLDISANRAAMPQGRANASPQHAFAACLPPHIPQKGEPPRCR